MIDPEQRLNKYNTDPRFINNDYLAFLFMTQS